MTTTPKPWPTCQACHQKNDVGQWQLWRTGQVVPENLFIAVAPPPGPNGIAHLRLCGTCAAAAERGLKAAGPNGSLHASGTTTSSNPRFDAIVRLAGW
jgi:hypothetical protein